MKFIRSSRVVLPHGIKEACICIQAGKIVDILENVADFPEDPLLVDDLGELLVMPGVVDPHVHINEPGRTEWEGFDTASKAALAGGITSLVDMPLNSSPVTTNPAAFGEKLKATQGKLHTNIGFWGGVVPGNIREVEALIALGVLGFKAFLTHSGIDDFPNVQEADLRLVMPLLARHNMPLLVHCELPDSIRRTPGDPCSYGNYLASRPSCWEVDAISLMLRLAAEYNCSVHIVHLSAASAIPLIEEARHQHIPVSVETAQHYLYFSAEDIPDRNTIFKCAPPIREKANNDKLWEAMERGIIDFVATDHSPSTPGLKEIASGNLLKAWGGIASLQFALPVLWTAAGKRKITMEKVVEWLCEKPAAFIGKGNLKGKIVEGFDADLVVFDDKASFRVNESIILHKHKITPYLNEELTGVVRQTYVGGAKVYENGQVIAFNKGSLILRS